MTTAISRQQKRVVIAGFGDTGMLTAIHLADRGYDIVGITTKPALLSGQELGARLTRPQWWKRHYLNEFRQFPKLAGCQVMQGAIESIDPQNQSVSFQTAEGEQLTISYDLLLLSSGVSNGFWRHTRIQDRNAIETELQQHAEKIRSAGSVAVIGGGATGVSVAANIAHQQTGTKAHLFYSQEQPLPGYHPNVRNHVTQSLQKAGVHLHPGHRAKIPDGFECDQLTTEPVRWSGGQPPIEADCVLWAVGQVKPNNRFIPPGMLNEEGFVKANPFLQVPGYPSIFTVGDIAATDPHRSSARNWGFRIAAHNIHQFLAGKPEKMKQYRAPDFRWGSVIGVQAEGLRVYQPNGGQFRFPAWSIETLLFPFAVNRMIYRGVSQPD